MMPSILVVALVSLVATTVAAAAHLRLPDCHWTHGTRRRRYLFGRMLVIVLVLVSLSTGTRITPEDTGPWVWLR